MGTLVVDTRALLVAGLSSLPDYIVAGPTGQVPEVTFAYRVGSKKRERVWTQNARFHHEPASMRAAKTFRNETATFELVILIEGVGLDPETTSTRAVELGAAAEDWVAIHANWNGLVEGLNWLQIEGDGALTEAFNDKGSLAELVYPLAYRARLT